MWWTPQPVFTRRRIGQAHLTVGRAGLALSVFGVTGVLGLTPEGKSAEDIARQRGLLEAVATREE
jgi:hypothetical protein